ncbi:MAG: tRNA (adenosine(37)-N6)-threonylcarbamoyltransferase complex dimerization subunit type 1 TsaB [Acidobacteriaceae bacterium]|nr:tRNA (adenosine(37)-N6)-threonylcarbamoyltransferase complex dimerization subunit type 1 TsaB [Acidobacteriaceae bacterium]
MIVLAVDTTSEFGSLALRSGDETLAEMALHAPEGFAHLLFPAIEQLLSNTALHLDRIDRFAAASGPGSFTGVRIGLAAIKGLAAPTGKPAIGVSNLRALSSFGHLPLRAVLLDARRGEVYAAVYDANLQAVMPETVARLHDWLATLTEPVYEFIASSEISLDGTRFAAMPRIQPPKQLAAAVASCAAQDPPADPVLLDANYVRRSDAELFWRDPASPH